MQQSINKKASLFLASVPEHALFEAKALVEKHGGFCAAFTQFDPLSPKKMSLFQFLKLLFINLFVVPSFAATWDLLEEFFESWTVKGKWKFVWAGRVTGVLEMLKSSYPQKTVIQIAVKGGRQCDWEQQQLLPGGKVHDLYPDMPLVVYKDLEDLRNFLNDSNLEFVNALIEGASNTDSRRWKD